MRPTAIAPIVVLSIALLKVAIDSGNCAKNSSSVLTQGSGSKNCNKSLHKRHYLSYRSYLAGPFILADLSSNPIIS